MVKYLKQRTNHKHIKNDYIHCLVPMSAENRINYTNLFLVQNLTQVFSKRLQKHLSLIGMRGNTFISLSFLDLVVYFKMKKQELK